MQVVCLGLDPAGLYLGILLKRTDPAHRVRLIEAGDAAAFADPAPFLCNPLKPRLQLKDSDVAAAVGRELASFDTVEVKTGDREFRTRGLPYAAIDGETLTSILRREALRLGCAIERRTLSSLEEFADADLLVVADGAASPARALSGRFAPSLRPSKTEFIALNANRSLQALSYAFRKSPAGLFHAFAYPCGRHRSVVIIEAPAAAVRAAKLDQAPAPESLSFCRKLFPEFDLVLPADGEPQWRPFVTVRNANWHAGNILLLGRAAYTSHFSVGLDLRSAMEDAEALVEHVGMHASLAEALAGYEAARRAKAESLQRAAQASLTWFEHVERMIDKPFAQFVFSLLTSSMRINYPRIGKIAPDLVREVDDLVAVVPPGSNLRSPPPMFSPYRLRELTFPNRIVVSPMCMYSAVEGTVNDFHLVHLGSRAVGGAGLVFTEMADVLPEGRISLHCAGMYADEHVPAWARIVDFVHEHSNSRIGIQLAHAGRKGSLTRSWEGHRSLGEAKWEIVAPSPIAFAEGRQVPKEMTRADMDKVRDAFVRATQMSEAAGFDMIELHFAHGYLLSSFISPLSNHRRDEYGGPLANRMRFPLEVFSAVRAAWPAHKPISTRISAFDWVDGGTSMEDAIEIARLLRDAGNDILAVSTGGVTSERRAVSNGRLYQAAFSEQIRNALDIPTMAVGGIVSHGDANTLIAAGRADMCAIARGYLVDPYFVRHAAHAQGYDGLAWPPQYRRAKEVRMRGT